MDPPELQNTTAPITTGSVWATEGDWNQHLAEIEQLYKQENKTLVEVQQVMEKRHGFKATLRMYKTQIAKYGLDKRTKNPESKAVARKNRHRTAIGKRPLFQPKRKEMKFEEVIAYLESKALSLDDTEQQQNRMTMGYDSTGPAKIHWDCDLDYATSILSSLQATPELKMSEEVLRSIGDYFRGSYEANTWLITDSNVPCVSIKPQGHCTASLDTFYGGIMAACQMLDRGAFDEAGRALVNATKDIQDIIRAEHPFTLCRILQLMACLQERKRPEISRVLLNQLSGISKLILGERHPLHAICSRLASLEPDQLEEAALLYLGRAADSFSQLAGPLHLTTLWTNLSFIHKVEMPRDRARGEAALQRLLHQCELTCGKCDGRTLDVLTSIAWTYYEKHEYKQTIKVATEIITRAQHVKPEKDAPYFLTKGYHAYAYAQHASHELGQALAGLKKGLDLDVSIWGWQHGSTMVDLVVMENWLVEWEHFESAEEVRNTRIEIQESMYNPL